MTGLSSDKKIKVCYALLICLIFLLIGALMSCGYLEPAKNKDSTQPLTLSTQNWAAKQPYLTCSHYEEKAFLKALAKAGAYQLEGKMLAATSPHFLPAMDYTANILSTLKEQQPDCQTIFVIAPNHSGEGLPIIVADQGWSTPYGRLEIDEEATAAILRAPSLAGKMSTDPYHLQNDHSAAVIMPFIKYYLPDLQVVTILLSRACSLEQLEELTRLIYDYGKTKSIFLLASLDYSHYLPISETTQRDKITQALIESGDIQAIKSLDSGYLDSPEALIILLNYAAYFDGAKADLFDYIILPESEVRQNIGYSYQVYLFQTTKSIRASFSPPLPPHTTALKQLPGKKR
ncbi:MAG: AmmeMemoRadiSam system protein B [Clostridiales bacterium]|nr:AmmeMemoRadiSam system protein B [Clostridiales bacterium]